MFAELENLFGVLAWTFQTLLQARGVSIFFFFYYFFTNITSIRSVPSMFCGFVVEMFLTLLTLTLTSILFLIDPVLAT